LRDAATSAAAHQGVPFLLALDSRPLQDPDTLIVQVVAGHLARQADKQWLKDILKKLAEVDPSVAEAIVRGLADGWPRREPDSPALLDPSLEQHLETVFQRLSPTGRGALLRLSATWGSNVLQQRAAEIYSQFLQQINDNQLDLSRRVEAVQQYAAFAAQDAQAIEKLLDAIQPRTPPALSLAIVRSLSSTDVPQTATLLLERFAGMTPQVRSVALSVLLSRSDWTLALLQEIEKGTVAWTDLTLDQRQSLANHPQQVIRRRATALLERGGALPSPDRQRVLQEWLPVAEMEGNAAAGREVFKKHCAKCHVHSGEGTRIGPDLTGMAVHPKHELLTQILDPSRSVEGNFRAYTVVTSDGLVITGLLAGESQTTLELFDSEGNKRTLLREDVEQMVASSKSLMPEGFEKQLSQQEMADLLAFLTARGKFIPLDLSKVATVPSDQGMFYSREADVERLIFSDWEPKTFRGVPFHLIDPRGGRVPNVILLYSPLGNIPPNMPRRVELPCHTPVKAIHFLSGVSGWGFPYSRRREVCLIVRLVYSDGTTEDHELRNGEHFADYIRRVDVPGSEFAFALRGQQVRYFSVTPKRSDTIEKIEILKGPDNSAPVIMAITLETFAPEQPPATTVSPQGQ
jgi:hypothetical protein